MFIVDASVLVSRLVAEDVNHEPSRLWLQQEIENGTPNFVKPGMV